MLYEDGLVNRAGKILIPPGTMGAISAALIIDPVLTGEEVNTDFPPGVQNLTIVRADNEYRTLFEAANYNNPSAAIYDVVGNHGDAGDAYGDDFDGTQLKAADNNLGGIYLKAYTSFFKNAGLTGIADEPSGRTYADGINTYVHSEGLTLSQVLADPIDGYDATYNSLPITDPDYLGVTRETNTYGTTPATVTGSSTKFTSYNGDIVLGGTGGNYGFEDKTVALVAGAQATVTNSNDDDSDEFYLANGAQLTLVDSSADINANNAAITLDYTDADPTIYGGGNHITLGVGANFNDGSLQASSDTITFDLTGSSPLTIAAGTALYSSTDITNDGTGNVGATLTTAKGTALGTLSYNTTTDTEDFNFTNGLSVALSAITGDVIAAVSPFTSALNTVADYLTDLGYAASSAALDALNSAYLNPVAADGDTYTVTGTVVGSLDEFDLTDNTPGAQVTGIGGKYNVLYLSGEEDSYNISQDTISNIQQLDTLGADVTLTNAQFTDIGTITGSGVITAADSGTFDLAAGNVAPNADFDLTASDWNGTTLIGNNADNQTLTASMLGDDTLIAGNGIGDTLIAGAGVDILEGGTGDGGSSASGSSGNTFIAVGTSGSPSIIDGVYDNIGSLASGSAIEGQGTGNILVANGDISSVEIDDIQTLITGDSITATSITLTNAQWNGFDTIQLGIVGENAFAINAATGGTYELATKDAASTDSFSMTALSNSGTTLIGNEGNFEILTASAAGNDILTAGNGFYDQLIAGGGDDTLTVGNGDIATLTAGTGTDTLMAGNGDGDTLVAGTGVDTLISGTGNNDTFVATGGLTAGSTVEASGTDAILQATGDITGSTISGIWELQTNDITLTASQFNGFTAISGNGDGGDITGTTSGTYNLASLDSGTESFDMTATSSGGTTLIGNDGDDEVLTASDTGNDTLTAGNGDDVVLVAGGVTIR